MRGPTEFGDWVYLELDSENDQVFRPGRYRVISVFHDRDGFQHRPGDEWLLIFASFNKFDEEMVLFVSLDERHQWTIPLLWEPNGQEEVIEGFGRFAEWIGPLPSGFPPPKNP